MVEALRTVVVIPVKAFERAKLRLAPALDASSRATLARYMAEVVAAAAAPLPVRIVCDDESVRDWATSIGAQISWTPGLGLNGAVEHAMAELADEGAARAVVAHADLPFARDLPAIASRVPEDGIGLVPDRRDDGTNVIVLPTATDFEFSYGGGSFERHRRRARSCGARLVVLRHPQLGWDVDEPGDLDAPDWARSTVLAAAGLDGATGLTS